MKRKSYTEKEHKTLGMKLFFAGLMGLATIATVFAILFIVPINHGTEEEHVIDVVKRKTKIEHPVEKAMKALCLELEKSDDPWLTGKGVEKQLNKLTTGPVTINYNLNISNAPQLDGATIGADGTFMRTVDTRKMYLHTDISVSRMKMLLADLYGEEDKLYLCLPEITDKDCILLNTENIDKQYNESSLASYVGKKIPMELSVYPYETFKIDVPQQLWMKELFCELFLDEDSDEDEPEIHFSEIDKLDVEDTIRIGENEVKLRTYGVEDDDRDIYFEIALDKSKNVRSISFPESVQCNDITICSGTICFLGEENITEQVDVDLELELGLPQKMGLFHEGKIQVKLDAKAEEALTLYIAIWQEEMQAAFSGQVEWADLENLNIDMRYLTVKEKDRDIIKITGTIDAVADVLQMPQPTGEIVDALHMNDMELLVTFMPWAKNIEKRYGAFLEMIKDRSDK